MKKREAFTLIEVLISIGLMGIIVVALFSVVAMLQESNAQLFEYLQKAKQENKAMEVLFLDIASSDGNLTLVKEEQSRLCIGQTTHSLYGLALAKVCWVVLKADNTLIRIEGNDYTLPTHYEDRVEIDRVIKNIELFDIYHNSKEGKVLVMIKQKNKDGLPFVVQGLRDVNKPKKQNFQQNINPTKTPTN